MARKSEAKRIIGELDSFLASLNDPTQRLEHLLRKHGAYFFSYDDKGLTVKFSQNSSRHEIAPIFVALDPDSRGVFSNPPDSTPKLFISGAALDRARALLSPDDTVRASAQETLIKDHDESKYAFTTSAHVVGRHDSKMGQGTS